MSKRKVKRRKVPRQMSAGVQNAVKALGRLIDDEIIRMVLSAPPRTGLTVAKLRQAHNILRRNELVPRRRPK